MAVSPPPSDWSCDLSHGDTDLSHGDTETVVELTGTLDVLPLRRA